MSFSHTEGGQKLDNGRPGNEASYLYLISMQFCYIYKSNIISIQPEATTDTQPNYPSSRVTTPNRCSWEGNRILPKPHSNYVHMMDHKN